VGEKGRKWLRAGAAPLPRRPLIDDSVFHRAACGRCVPISSFCGFCLLAGWFSTHLSHCLLKSSFKELSKTVPLDPIGVLAVEIRAFEIAFKNAPHLPG